MIFGMGFGYISAVAKAVVEGAREGEREGALEKPSYLFKNLKPQLLAPLNKRF
jgi:hypothetical protein